MTAVVLVISSATVGSDLALASPDMTLVTCMGAVVMVILSAKGSV